MDRPNPIPKVSPRPPSPNRRDPTTFADRADARFDHDLNIADPELSAIGEAISDYADYIEHIADSTQGIKDSAIQELSTIKDDSVADLSNVASGFLSQVEQLKTDTQGIQNATTLLSNAAAQSALTAGEQAASATNAQSLAQSAQSATENARDAAILAASEVGALVLDDARKVVRRSHALYFGLNLNPSSI